MPFPMADVLIADGGISGLAVALSIARQRHRVLVLERRDSYTELGLGTRLSPNALHALDRLDLGNPVRERSAHVEGLRLVEGPTGAVLATVAGSGDPAHCPANCPSMVIRRSDLFSLMLDACRRNPDIRLRTDACVARYEQQDEQVTAFLETGEQYTGDALVGAGSPYSPVRHQVVGSTSRISRNVFYHSVVPAERMPVALRSNALKIWATPGWQLIQCPTGYGGSFDLSAHCDGKSEAFVEDQSVGRTQVLRNCPGVTGDARTLLMLGEDWRMWVPPESSPVMRWADNRVVLTGDTDRPLLPFAAQHASHQTVEDAVHLGDLMDCDTADFPQAFRTYAAHRRMSGLRATSWAFHAMFAEGPTAISGLYGMG